MTRRRLIPPALAASALLLVTACSSAGSTTAPDNSDAGKIAPRDTAATSSTEPTTTHGDPTSEPGGSTTTITDPAPQPQGFGSGRLNFFGDCPALLDYMQDAATERVTAWGLGGGGYYGPDMVGERDLAAVDEMADGASEAAPMPTGDVDTSYSGTNTQELGVDEGDVVETDGEYVYTAAYDAVRIVAVADAEIVDELDLPQGAHQLLLAGDRLLVITTGWSGSADTVVSLYDVSDPTDAARVLRSHLEGATVASRSIDGVARLAITTAFDQRLPFVQPNQFGLDEESALERNEQIIAESTVQDWLPRMFVENADGGFGPMSAILDCENVAAPAEFSGLGLTWIASIDTAADSEPVGSAGIVSTGSTVYASTDNLYVATQNWDWQWGGPIPLDDVAEDDAEPTTTVAEPVGPPPTMIHQFSLDDGTGASYVASGQVEGRLLNQFAMSEYEGDLRVATTTDDRGNFGDQSESTVFVLRPNGDELEQLSSIGGLGKDEQIYAVRFLGDVGYVVTFRQIDPLYVLDLSDPEHPVLDGELKIPGYSAYLHPVGDDLLLGVGQDATDQGRTTGTKLSLFDVSDPSDPQLVSSLPVGGHSEAEWDHHAFLYWEPDGTIVIPVSPGWGDCGPADTCLAKEIAGAGGGAIVARLVGEQLTARGVISHGPSGRHGCWNPLQRSMIIDDEIVTVGVDRVQFNDRDTLDTRDVVSWGDPDQYGCSWYVD